MRIRVKAYELPAVGQEVCLDVDRDVVAQANPVIADGKLVLVTIEPTAEEKANAARQNLFAPGGSH